MKHFGLWSLLTFLFLFILLLFGFDHTKTQLNEQDFARIERTVQKAAYTCYSIEGYYPQDLAYLEEHYDVHIDEERYRIHYEWIADNVRPDILVIAKGDD